MQALRIKRRRVIGTFLLAILALTIISSISQFSAQASLTSTTVLTASGEIVRTNQTPTNINGFNLPVFAWRWAGVDIKAELAKIRSEGFNAIRIFIYWGNLTPTQGVINQAYFTENSKKYGLSIDNWVNECTSLNMSCILSLAFSKWEPPPSWAFPTLPPPPVNLPETSYGATWYGAICDNMMNSSSPAAVQSINQIWSFISQRYANNPWVVFDIFNEPRRDKLPQDMLASNYNAFATGVVNNIRASEQVHHRVIVEWYIGVYVPDNITVDVIRDINWYGPWQQPYNSTTMFSTYMNEFSKMYKCVSNTGLPVMSTEFGRILHPTPMQGSEDWYRDAFTIFNSFGIKSWLIYCYSYNTTEEPYSIINSDGTLVQPYFSMIQANLPK